MQGVYTVLLLILSNIFMTIAWYGHLKLQQSGISSNWPLIGVILFSWGIALFEYLCQVPANRLGIIDNGGPFSLIQLKIIQEVISLLVLRFSLQYFSKASILLGIMLRLSSAWWPLCISCLNHSITC